MLISGLALPREAVYQGHRIFDEKTTIIASEKVPLFAEHALAAPLGEVLRFYFDEAGLHYIARIDNIEAFKKLYCDENACDFSNIGASIGAKFQQFGDEKYLLIYEVSLTNDPYFETFPLNVLASNLPSGFKIIQAAKSEEKNKGFIEKNVNLSGMEEQLTQLVEQVASIQNALSELSTQLADLAARVSKLEEGVEASKTLATEAKVTAENVAASVGQSVDKTLASFLETHLAPQIQKVFQVIQK